RPHYADKFVDMLCGIAGTVIFTAAKPGQGGLDHFNEQPNEYWIKKFAERNFHYEKDISMRFRQQWEKGGVSSWYCSNLMVFRGKKKFYFGSP
ncbi:MAG: hypothetical protein Q8N81_05300, partial [bacterium]|nr:hypothetical protein [bacterium]